ncbi:MAG: MFS transporter [Chloroflexi bacterium]|nr:MFS transporter [Chloroflexota bacterium]
MHSTLLHRDDGRRSGSLRQPLPWDAIGLAFAVMFVVMGSRSGYAVIYPALVADLGWSVAEVTGAYSFGLLVYAPLAIVAGLAVDRLGCRSMMLFGSVMLAAGMTVVALSTELWHLYVAFVLALGLGSGGLGFITTVKMLSMRAGSRFATAFGLGFMGQGLGSLVVSPAMQAIVDAAGWRPGALAIALLAALGLVPLIWWLAPGPEPPGSARHGAPASGGRIFSPLFCVFFATNMALGFQMLVPTHQVAYVLDLGFSAVLAATAAGAWGALMSVGTVSGGWALDRWGLARLLGAALVLFGGGMVALVVSAPEVGWLLVVFVLANGMGRGFLSVALGSSQTRTFAGPRLGRITGLLDVGFGSGAFLGPWLTAVVHDATGTFAPGFLAAAGASSLVAVGLLAGRRLTDRPPRPTPPPASRQPASGQPALAGDDGAI